MVEQGDRQAEGGGRLTGYKTPAQRLEAAHIRIDKLTDEVDTLHGSQPLRTGPPRSCNVSGECGLTRC